MARSRWAIASSPAGSSRTAASRRVVSSPIATRQRSGSSAGVSAEDRRAWERDQVGRGLQRGRPGQERLEIALMAGDGGACRLGPDLHVGVDGIPPLGGQCPRHVHEGVRVESQVTDPAGPFRRIGRRLVEGRGQGRAGLGEMAAGDGLGAPVVGQHARGLLDEEHRVPEARQTGRDRAEGRRSRRGAGVAEGQQVRGEAATVDGGHVAGLQRTEAPAGVVPVVGWKRSRRRSVAKVASSRSSVSRTPSQPKSRAETTASR